MTQPSQPDSWCEIHRDRIARNIDLALGLVPAGRRFCAVMKADAYGHGIAQVVPLIQDRGIDCIGVISNTEAAAVREAGFHGSLIRLRVATPNEMRDALPFQVEEQVSSLSAAEALNAQRQDGHTVRAHLTLNARGMSRDGLEIATETGREICRRILDLLRDGIVGICTHYPSNSPEDLRKSAALFQRQVTWVFDNSDLQRDAVTVHAGSSLTLIADQPVNTDMYRCGAILYGILKPDLGFQATMDLKARVVSLAEYPAGSPVGYDGDCTLDRDRRLACVSIGYANGISRASQDRGAVLIRGQLAPVMGKISMNALVADVTDHSDVQVGDEVTVFGTGEDFTGALSRAEQQFRTIMADLFTDWGQRNPRLYR